MAAGGGGWLARASPPPGRPRGAARFHLRLARFARRGSELTDCSSSPRGAVCALASTEARAEAQRRGAAPGGTGGGGRAGLPGVAGSRALTHPGSTPPSRPAAHAGGRRGPGCKRSCAATPAPWSSRLPRRRASGGVPRAEPAAPPRGHVGGAARREAWEPAGARFPPRPAGVSVGPRAWRL